MSAHIYFHITIATHPEPEKYKKFKQSKLDRDSSSISELHFPSSLSPPVTEVFSNKFKMYNA
jgi:hypothetical protein